MKICLRTHMVSDDPLERIDYCQQLAIATVQESAKPIAAVRGWPPAMGGWESAQAYGGPALNTATRRPT